MNDVLTDDEKNAAGVIVGEGKYAPKTNPHYDAKLRDEFAMTALRGIMSDARYMECINRASGAGSDDAAHRLLAKHTYLIADAMMEARKK